MNSKDVKISLIMVLLIGLPSGFVIGNWFWSSQTFTHSVTIGGNIDAKTNFLPATTFATAPSYIELVTSDDLIQLVEDGDYYLWIILSPESEAPEAYIRVMVSPPEGGSATATVETQIYNVGTGSVAPILIRSIATDGIDTVKIERGGDSQWVFGSTFGVSYRFIRVRLMFDNTLLPDGDYEYFIRVEIGDSP